MIANSANFDKSLLSSILGGGGLIKDISVSNNVNINTNKNTDTITSLTGLSSASKAFLLYSPDGIVATGTGTVNYSLGSSGVTFQTNSSQNASMYIKPGDSVLVKSGSITLYPISAGGNLTGGLVLFENCRTGGGTLTLTVSYSSIAYRTSTNSNYVYSANGNLVVIGLIW